MDSMCPTCGRQTDLWGRCPACGVSTTKKAVFRDALGMIGILIGVLIVMGFLISRFSGNPLRIFQTLGIGQPGLYEVTRASKNLPIPKDPQETISPQQIGELRERFENREFESLNLIFEQYRQDLQDDFNNEYGFKDAFRIFHTTLPSYEGRFEDWIENSPAHFAPYLARAHYYFAKGWEAWGPGGSEGKTQEQFKLRWYNFQKAIDDINTALAINEKLLTAYTMRINISATMAQEEQLRKWAKEALELFPHSFLIRSEYIRVISPRWSGSYRKMENFAKSAEAHVDMNPYLACLYGFIYIDQAQECWSRKKYDQALALYTRATSFGDYWYFYTKRAEAFYVYLKDLDKALADVEHSIYLRPTIERSYHLRSRIHFEQEDFEAAADDLQTARHLNPNDAEIRRWQEWAASHLLDQGHRLFETDLNRAVEKYKYALMFNSENPEAFYWRAVAYWHQNRLDLAVKDLRQACDLGHKEACDRYHQAKKQRVN